MRENIDKETGFLMPTASDFNVADLFDLKNETALITGAANGIGRVAAIVLGKAGAKIAITDINFEEAKILETELLKAGVKAKAWHMDAKNEKNIIEVFDKVDKILGDTTILINNAGTAHRSAAEKMSTEDFENIIRLNLTGSFICARTAAQRMLKNKRGSIINIASIMGVTGGGPAPNSPYHASKGAIVNLTRSLANEWGPKGIRVNAIVPGWIMTERQLKLWLIKETDKWRQESQCLPDRIYPIDVSKLALFLASPDSKMMTSQFYKIDAGWMN